MSQFANFDSDTYCKSARGKDTSQNFNLNEDQGSTQENRCCPASDSFQSDRRNKSLLGRPKRPEQWNGTDYDNFNKTTSKILKSSFSHHHPQLCVCEQCNCGRHLCQFKAQAKPDLSKTSIYKQSYDRKTPIPNNINIASDYDKLKGPHLDLNSNYKHDYDGKKGDPNFKHRPEDLLKNGGPCANLTSYSSGFPGFKCVNQYVPHTDNAVRSNFPLLSKTTYGNAFASKSVPKPRVQKIPDNLKPRDLWMGKTTYGNFFQQPNPEDYAKRNKNQDKLLNDPKYGRQYETTYKNSFLGPVPTICPAKVALQTKHKGFFSNSKDTFTENTDFKALNPNYHAISTSKHSYV